MLIGLALAVIAVGTGVFLGWRAQQQAEASDAPLARAERLRKLPSFANAVRSRQRALIAVIAVGVIVILAGGVLAARPMASESIRPSKSDRDIMLCLDVSGSMADVDVEILDVFLELFDRFEGERIGLTIFNSSAVQVFPLTDDYVFAADAMQSLRDSFDEYSLDSERYTGTLNGNGASLIGDGLAACTLGFDGLEDPDQPRSRSVIFASDNEINGSPIVTVPEAAAFAKSKNVKVYAINPVSGIDSGPTEELRTAAESTGGAMYDLRGTTTVSDIVNRVQKEDAQERQGEIKVIWHDDPALWMVIFIVLSLAFVVVVWRVRL